MNKQVLLTVGLVVAAALINKYAVRAFWPVTA